MADIRQFYSRILSQCVNDTNVAEIVWKSKTRFKFIMLKPLLHKMATTTSLAWCQTTHFHIRLSLVSSRHSHSRKVSTFLSLHTFMSSSLVLWILDLLQPVECNTLYISLKWNSCWLSAWILSERSCSWWDIKRNLQSNMTLQKFNLLVEVFLFTWKLECFL